MAKDAEKTAQENAAPKMPDQHVDSNVFTELFGKDKVAKSSGMMDTVMAQQSRGGVKAAPLPVRSSKQISKRRLKLKKKRRGALMLRMTVLLWILGTGFFVSQNTQMLDFLGFDNPASQYEASVLQVERLKAEIVYQHHHNATLLLDQLNGQLDAYLYNKEQALSPFNSENSKDAFEAGAEALLPSIAELVLDIQAELSAGESREDVILAKTVIDELISELEQSSEVNEASRLQAIQDLETAKTLMQSKDFITFMIDLSPSDLDDAELESLFLQYSSINQSVASLINTISGERMDFTEVILELERLVKSVDPLFNTEFESNITVSRAEVSVDGRVTISGDMSTDDSRNFTLLSNLVDTIENSEMFDGVEQRSFSKSEQSERFTSNFQLSFSLSSITQDNE